MNCNSQFVDIQSDHTIVIACATVIKEMLPLLPQNMRYEVLDFGLHVSPEKLKSTLQNKIDILPVDIKTVILGYGLCSQAVIGLKAAKTTLIIPRVEDCIAIFLGSMKTYREQLSSTPGTYYLTKGWIEANSTPFSEFDILVNKYGEEKAWLITKKIFKNYTRLVFINTGQDNLDKYRRYTRNQADKFGLQYEEIAGSNSLIRKMLYGPFDDDFIIAPPGKAISLFDFKKVK